MNELSFPSGPWIGFYVHRPGKQRHRMDLALTFAAGQITGSGSDDVGKFVIRGRFTARSGECHWTKTYVGAHDVFYRGYREGRGIWGTWELSVTDTGGFHIWPLAYGESDDGVETEEKEQPVDAIGELVGSCVTGSWHHQSSVPSGFCLGTCHLPL